MLNLTLSCIQDKPTQSKMIVEQKQREDIEEESSDLLVENIFEERQGPIQLFEAASSYNLDDDRI